MKILLTCLQEWPTQSSKISPTVLVFRHPLQVHMAAVLCTFSNWIIWVLRTWGCQIGTTYSNLGWTKVLYAASFVCLGVNATFCWRKHKVFSALAVITDICWPKSRVFLIIIPRYLVDWTAYKVYWCRLLSNRKIPCHPNWVTFGKTEFHLLICFPTCQAFQVFL